MLVKENMEKLIQAREQVLNLRHNTEIKNMKSLFNKQLVTPNTF